MRSSFFGFEVARRALFAQQRAMDVAAHNIANANQPAYSRQRAEMAALAPYAPPGTRPGGVAGQVGTGVWVRAIVRLRDVFLDNRIRSQSELLAGSQTRRQVLEQLERIMDEPSENGLRMAMDRFWEALQELSVTPDSVAVRNLVVERGRVLADTVRRTFSQLQALREDLDRDLELKVERLNSLAEQVASLNRQIRQVGASGQNPNDLRDARDALLDEMAQLAGVSITVRAPLDESVSGEQVAVSVGGLSLVDGAVVHRLVLDGTFPDRVLRWESPSGPTVLVPGGEIAALLAMRGTLGDDPGSVQGYLPQRMQELDAWIREFVEAFNQQHRLGFDLDRGAGGDFFEPPQPWQWYAPETALSVTLTPRGVAAAATREGVPGDGANALALAGLKARALDGLGSLVSGLGVDVQQAQTEAENQKLLVDHLKGIRESISGVSLDEEMADLLRFQHAYGAAARAMTAMDEVLDTLIHRTGLAGR